MVLLTTFFYSCQNKEKPVDIQGKTLKSIQANVIITEDGKQLALEEDSIAQIYYLIRHAEKDTSVKEEPPLTEAGLQRATKLADIMRGTRVDAIYSTLTVRTMFTVDSLADIKAMKILPYDNKSLKELLADIKNAEQLHRIFIVGHSNTIPSITNTLAGREIFNKVFDESDYSNFVIVVVKKSGLTDVYTLKY